MKKIIFVAILMTLTGCASTVDTIRKYWPRDHDPVAFHQLVIIDVAIGKIDCEKPDWIAAVDMSEVLAKNAEWRRDPQAENLHGLHRHTLKMFGSNNKTFCEIGKRTALERIDAVKSAWARR
jgi:hypothetical protein